MKIKLIELFSGIGGFTKGLQDAGFEIEEHYFSEIDKHAIANYKYNFPHAKYIGDVKSIQSGDFTGIDIITFGSPCQDFSLAGKRKGLEGSRSSLIQYAIDMVTDVRPSVFIWENVKGAFSSNSGADFWAILQAFANIGGYRLEWQLLNTKWVLPQNRERIYLIGHLDGRSKPGVFPFSEDNFGFNERSIETTNIRTLTAGGHSGGLHYSMTLLKVNSATSSGFEIATEGDSINFSNPKSKTRRGRVGKGVAQTLDCGCNQAVVQIKCSIESGGKQPYQQNRIYDVNGISPSLLKDKSDILINESYFIRRLTEIECEILQGFPPNWTKYGDYEGKIKPVPKTQRYKQLGNAVTSEIILRIGLRLKNLMQQPWQK